MAAKATLNQALAERRSLRQYADAEIGQPQLAQLLWAAQGLTGEDGQSTSPSAGAQYPIEILVVAGRATDVAAGVYRYRVNRHELELTREGDIRSQLCAAALAEQPWVAEAAIVLVPVADLTAMQAHFQEQPPAGKRGERYAYLEAGAMAQNICLQATGLNLGAVLVGGFDDDAVGAALNLGDGQRATALICIGQK